MLCKEISRVVRGGVGDLLTDDEIFALMEWHAGWCKVCRKEYASAVREAEMAPPRECMSQIEAVWKRVRLKLRRDFRSARRKLKKCN